MTQIRPRSVRALWNVTVAFAALLAGCWSSDSEDSRNAAGGDVTITGAGATFPYPIYSRWFAKYSDANPVRVNYQSVGSGAGIQQMIEGTVDFGATDAPLTDQNLAQIPGTLSIPMVLGSVAITYNLSEIRNPLRLDGATIAGIFLGEIARWNDPRIAALNPGVPLPNRDIIAVYRADGSGTTYVFTDYLAEVSPEWRDVVGRGNAVSWPTGLGARGNEGISGQVQQTPGSIGYVEQVFARQNNLPMAEIANQDGDFVAPSIEATTLAASGLAARIPANNDFRLSIVNAPGAGAYPISSWTYLLVAPHFEDCGKGRALLDLIRWSLIQGEADAVALHYAPLSEEVCDRALEAIEVVTCGANRAPILSR
jgi:phosphate transport system substrate-binding protein